MAEEFKIIPTQDPSRVSIRVKVSTANIRGDEFPKIGDKYRDLRCATARRQTEGWGDYTYALMFPSESDGFIEFVYAAPIDADTASKPFRSTPNTSTAYTWPAVLKELNFPQDSRFPFGKDYNGASSSAYAARTFVSYIWRSAWSGVFNIIEDEYLSNTPWTTEQLYCRQPIPQRVHWDFLGSARDLGECLHPTVKVPSLGRVTVTDLGSGTTTTGQPAVDGSVFPRTNFTDWAAFRLSATQTLGESGQYYIKVITALPPPKRKTHEFTN
jgi:hypothetical protein